MLSSAISGAIPIIFSPCRTAPKYSSALGLNSCHQTFNQEGKTKIEFQFKRWFGSVHKEARLAKVSWVMVSVICLCISVALGSYLNQMLLGIVYQPHPPLSPFPYQGERKENLLKGAKPPLIPLLNGLKTEGWKNRLMLTYNTH